MYPDKLTDRIATLLLYASPSLLFRPQSQSLGRTNEKFVN